MNLPLIPGIYVQSGVRPLGSKPFSPVTGSEGGANLTKSLDVNGWMSAQLITRLEADAAVCEGFNGTTVLFDGYLTDIKPGRTELDIYHKPAQSIAVLYHDYGLDALLQLRGSYQCLIVDHTTEESLLFNDRRASRPSKYRLGDNNSILIGPELHVLSRMDPDPVTLNQSAVCEFLLRGSYLADHTLFNEYSRLPQACCLKLTPMGHDFSKYWDLDYTQEKNQADENQLVEECHALINQATRRVLKATQIPVLFLSGGTDSRILLGSLLETGSGKIPVAFYGEQLASDSDFSTAKLLAEHCAIPADSFLIDMEKLPKFAPLSTLVVDGMAETIDTSPLVEFYGILSEKFNTFINGDECFGWQSFVTTEQQALDILGCFDLSQSARLRHWLHKPLRKPIAEQINLSLHCVVSRAQTEAPNDLKDKLYYQQRMNNMLNSFAGAKLRYLEQARPLLDEDLMEFIAKLPVKMRDDKHLLRQVLRIKFPELSKIPPADKDSIPVAGALEKRLLKDKAFADFMLSQLGELLDDRLAAMLDKGRLRKHIEYFIKEKKYPSILENPMLRLPFVWRFRNDVSQNKVHPFSILIRLVEINLYLKAIDSPELDFVRSTD